MISNYFLHFANKLRFIGPEGGQSSGDTKDTKEVRLESASPESKERRVPAEVMAQQLELALKSPLSGLSGINTVDTQNGQTRVEKRSMLFGSLGSIGKTGEEIGDLVTGKKSLSEIAKQDLHRTKGHVEASVAGGVGWLSSKFGLGRTTKNDFFVQGSRKVEAVPSGLADYIMSQLKQGMSIEQAVENLAKLRDWKSVGISTDLTKLSENDKGAGTLLYLQRLMQTGATDGQGGDKLVSTDNVKAALTGESPEYRKVLVDALQATVNRAGQNAKGLVEAELDGSISEVLVTDKNGDQKLLNVSQTRGWKWAAEFGIRRFTMNPVLQQFMVGATTLGNGPAAVAAWVSSVGFAQEQYLQAQTDIGKVANDMALAGYTPKEIVEVLKARVQSTLSDLGENPNDPKLQSKMKGIFSFVRKSTGFNFGSIDYSKAVTMGVNADAEMLITKLNDIAKAIETDKNLDVAKALNEALVDGVETDQALQAKQTENIEAGFGKKAQLPPDIMAGIKQFANEKMPWIVQASKRAGETKIGKAFNEKIGTKLGNWWDQATTKKFSEAAKVAIGEAFKNGEITAQKRDEAYEKLRMQDIGGKAVLGISGLGLLDVVNRPDHLYSILVNFGTGLVTSALFGAVFVGAKAFDDVTGNKISGVFSVKEVSSAEITAGTTEAVKAMTLTEAAEMAKNGKLTIGTAFINAEGKLDYIKGDGNGKPGDVVGATTVAALAKMVEEQKSQTNVPASTPKAAPETTAKAPAQEKSAAQVPSPMLDFFGNRIDLSKLSVGELFKDPNTGKVGSVYPGGRGLFEVTPTFVENAPKEIKILQNNLPNITDPVKLDLAKAAIDVRQTVLANIQALGGATAVFGPLEAVLSATATAPVEKTKGNSTDVAQVPAQPQSSNNTPGVFTVDAKDAKGGFRIEANPTLAAKAQSGDLSFVGSELYEQLGLRSMQSLTKLQNMAYEIVNNPSYVLDPKLANVVLDNGVTYGEAYEALKSKPVYAQQVASGIGTTDINRVEARSKFNADFSVFIGPGVAGFSGKYNLMKEANVVSTSRISGIDGNVKISIPKFDNTQNQVPPIKVENGIITTTTPVFNTVNGINQVNVELPGGQTIVITDPKTLAKMEQGISLQELVSEAIQSSPQLAQSLGVIDLSKASKQDLEITTKDGRTGNILTAIFNTRHLYSQAQDAGGRSVQQEFVSTGIKPMEILGTFLDTAANNPKVGAAILKEVSDFHKSGKFYSPEEIRTLTNEQRVIWALSRTLSPELLEKPFVTTYDLQQEAKGKQFDNFKPTQDALFGKAREELLANYNKYGRQVGLVVPSNGISSFNELKEAQYNLERALDTRKGGRPHDYSRVRFDDMSALQNDIAIVQAARGLEDSETYTSESTSSSFALGFIFGSSSSKDVEYTSNQNLTAEESGMIAKIVKMKEFTTVTERSFTMLGFVKVDNVHLNPLFVKLATLGISLASPFAGAYSEKKTTTYGNIHLNLDDVTSMRGMPGDAQEKAAKLIALATILSSPESRAKYRESLNVGQNTPNDAILYALGATFDKSKATYTIKLPNGKEIELGDAKAMQEFIVKARKMVTIVEAKEYEKGSTTAGHKVIDGEKISISTGGVVLEDQNQTDEYLKQFSDAQAARIDQDFKTARAEIANSKATFEKIRQEPTILLTAAQLVTRLGGNPETNVLNGAGKYRGNVLQNSVVDPMDPGTVFRVNEQMLNEYVQKLAEIRGPNAQATTNPDPTAIPPMPVFKAIMDNCDNDWGAVLGFQPNLEASGRQKLSNTEIGAVGANYVKETEEGSVAGMVRTPKIEDKPQQPKKEEPTPKTEKAQPNRPTEATETPPANTRPPGPENPSSPTNQSVAPGDGSTPPPPAQPTPTPTPDQQVVDVPAPSPDPSTLPGMQAPVPPQAPEIPTNTIPTPIQVDPNLPSVTVPTNVDLTSAANAANASTEVAAETLPSVLNPGAAGELTGAALNTGSSAAAVAGDQVIGNVANPMLP